MAKKKRSSFKSFGDIPRGSFSGSGGNNKRAEFKEDNFKLGPLHTDDAEEFGHRRSSETPPEVKLDPGVLEVDPEIAKLQDRINYYEHDTQEDPNIRALQLRQLRERLKELQDKENTAVAANVKTAESDTGAKKTGWWDKDFKKDERKEPELEPDPEPVIADEKDPQQMKDQMSRLIKKTGNLRKEAGLSDAEALEESEDYKQLKSEISKIRYRLNKILEDKGKQEYKEEIAELRHALAEHLVAFKRLSREKAKENSKEEGENEKVQQYPPLSEEEEIDARNWEGLSEALRDLSRGSKPKEEVVPPAEPKNEATTEPTPPTEPAELKNYEARRLLREDWKGKKEAYLIAYEQHLREQNTKKGPFWKKESKPQALIDAEQAYQEARRQYAGTLNNALAERAKTDKGGNLEGYEAGLANRFVLQAAHEKLAQEKEYLPDAKSLRVFERLQETLKKHKNLIKVSGYLAVVGIGIVSGGVAGALLAFGNKAVGAKLATIGAAGGATLGAYLGNSLSDTVINFTGSRRDSAAKRAQRKWSLETMDKRENEYLTQYKSHEKALRDKNLYIAAGTLAGGTLGAIAVGNLDSVVDVELPQIPLDPLPLPAIDDALPDPNVSDTPKETIFEKEIQEVPLAQPVVEEDAAVESKESNDDLPNASEAPVTLSPNDVTYFEAPVTVVDPETAYEGEEVSQNEGEGEQEEEPVLEQPEILHTFEAGSRVDTVSEALFETWKSDADTLDEFVTKKEFLAEMYGAIAEIEKNPELNAELMEKMGITSGDIDKVQVGQTIDLQPFFEYMNQRK